MSELLPWLKPDWDNYWLRYENKTLAHATIIIGPSGLGKSAFALFAAQTFLCRNPQLKGYCGYCDSCLLIAAGTHPDLLSLVLDDGQATIKIDQIRALIEKLNLTPQYNSYKIAIIDPADKMTPAAANSLLKTLEEPAAADLLILVSSNPGHLPATVRSRCQTIKLQEPDQQQALNWLQLQKLEQAEVYLHLASGLPLRAIQMSQGDELAFRSSLLSSWLDLLNGRANVIAMVSQFSSYERGHLMELLMHWSANCIKIRMGCEAICPDHEKQQLHTLSGMIENDKWFTFYEKMRHLRQIDSNSFKTPTVLEGIFADMRLSKFN